MTTAQFLVVMGNSTMALQKKGNTVEYCIWWSDKERRNEYCPMTSAHWDMLRKLTDS